VQMSSSTRPAASNPAGNGPGAQPAAPIEKSFFEQQRDALVGEISLVSTTKRPIEGIRKSLCFETGYR
jgi:hypothetical protein